MSSSLLLEKSDLVDQLDYYERLIDFLDEMIPNLEDVIEQFNEKEKNK